MSLMNKENELFQLYTKIYIYILYIQIVKKKTLHECVIKEEKSYIYSVMFYFHFV